MTLVSGIGQALGEALFMGQHIGDTSSSTVDQQSLDTCEKGAGDALSPMVGMHRYAHDPSPVSIDARDCCRDNPAVANGDDGRLMGLEGCETLPNAEHAQLTQARGLVPETDDEV